ncbi:hypothetical protein [Hymenobacter actinosclerus]|uniref:Outer membrane protein beta-barrel domain-containing protein n=1 Tax=Hymenobacter actinosclerus TaxID=82805 RepID=A0A1H9ZQU4_9BACT|nr:hypothetical protein [Hymenobacter actinosclerus]SES84077.1 hypothetical protein SAMN04487998_0435 [Hymenobacter actinosclerus]
MASANPPSDNHQPGRPSGDLEHLFRQKLAEAEVRPRANFWDQLDHELVAQQHTDMLRQNAMYRQRAAVYRWAAAACLVLALGVASWAYLAQSGRPAGPVLATATAPAAGLSGLGLTLPGGVDASYLDRLTSLAPASGAGADAQLVGAYGAGRSRRTLDGLAAAGYESAVVRADAGAAFGAPYSAPALLALPGSRSAAWGQPGNVAVSFDDLNLRDGLGLGRPGQRQLLAPAEAPAIRTVLTPEPAPKASGKLWKRLRVGGGYALSVFNPNINFSRADGRTKSDPVTDALRSYYQEDAEREYRRNLRSGPSQRVALTASYQLNPHWTVSTGAEWAESRASSATSFGFLDGKQVGSEAPDFFAQPTYRNSSAGFSGSNSSTSAARPTSYRYRTAAVPVSLSYGSQKAGLSLYAKAGAVVSLLINSRSELEGSPEATRSYDIRSAESPYRTLFASGRLGGGVRYQPVLSTWNVTVGPSAEVFITPLNANPSQRAARQTRPYSLGVEATIEFGSAKVMSVVQ